MTDRTINPLVRCFHCKEKSKECLIDLITEFEVRTVNYRPLALGSRLGHKWKGKKRGFVTHSTDREDQISNLL